MIFWLLFINEITVHLPWCTVHGSTNSAPGAGIFFKKKKEKKKKAKNEAESKVRIDIKTEPLVESVNFKWNQWYTKSHVCLGTLWNEVQQHWTVYFQVGTWASK